VRRLVPLLGLVVVAALAAAAPVTLARLTSAATGHASFATGTIEPPTALVASATGSTVTLTWTPTTSTGVTGYELLRSATSGSGFGVIATVTPRAASTTTDSPGVGTWFYALRSRQEAWRSVRSGEASATLSADVTAFTGCTTQAADTGGDNNGYEGSPANGCAVDGVVATDASSGTGSSVSCTSTQRDRHRFGGYALGVPSGASVIRGIEVRLTAGMNNNGGTTQICVQLSPDNGSTWTTAKTIALSATALQAYTTGGATDTWGRSWTPATLASGAFLVRLVNVTSQPSKDFLLDGVDVRVHYAP
jgi:hypothetical protein